MGAPYTIADLRELIAPDGLAYPSAIHAALNAAFTAGSAEERARMVALCLERGQHASAAGHHLVAVAWDEVREALEREGKS